MTESKTVDYIVVGAGSAGCVLASRHTADPDISVLLLEAGPVDRGWKIHMPAALAHPLAEDTHNWFYETEPEPHLDNRRIICPRGRVLGGSSSINGMAYVRGHALDYDRWAEEGAQGWSYAEVLPYFKRAETREKGGDAYRGHDGPLRVSTGACENPLFQAFVAAGQQAGYPLTEDMNGFQQEGVGPMDMTVSGGRRCSAAVAYLRPAMERPNLEVQTSALAARIRFEGRRAAGLDYLHHGVETSARARREVILCGGAVNSPQLLQVSGIGPADALKRLGIPVLADLPGVGANLQDHLECYLQQACKQPVSLYPALKPWNQLWIGLAWIFLKRGPGASSHFEAGGFIRSRAGVRHPDLQYHFLPIAMNYDGSNPARGHGYQAHIGPMRPTARGRIALRSADPFAAPSILFNYLETEGDRREIRDGIKLTREIFAQKAFEPFRGGETAPGADAKSDAEIDAFVRAHAESAYHPSCSCKMGADSDPQAVVDSQTRVRGLDALRVVDASIMPSIVSGNLNAPTIMLAEKAADTILGKAPLAPLDVPVYEAPDWQTRQR
ncbi:MAG: choline dehydrogenase [Kiloniellales bacterium]